MPADRVVVINPNSNEEVTKGLDAALDPLRFAGGPEIVCETLTDGPLGIESQADVEAVTLPLARRVHAGGAGAFVIACYSDPGLHLCREAATVPVFGIAESGLLTALQRGERVGVVAILRGSINRHLRQQRALGISQRIAGERALELTVAELGDERATWRRLVDIARRLKEENAADVVVLGCAGMARYRARLEAELDVPVIDPTQAAVGQALAAVALARAAGG